MEKFVKVITNQLKLIFSYRETSGVKVKVIAGESMNIKSPVRTRTPTYYLDFEMKPGSSFVQNVPQGWTTFIYTLEGEIKLNEDKIEAHHTVVFSKEGEEIQFKNDGKKPARFVLIGGQPIGEPIVQHGPFVMNTREEINQAIKDYQLGQNGFENAHKWESIEGNK